MARWGSRLGKNRFSSFVLGDEEIKLLDFVFVAADDDPFIAIVTALWEDDRPNKMVKLRWLFRPSDLPQVANCRDKELLLAVGDEGVENENDLEVVLGKCRCKFDLRSLQARDLEGYDYFVYRGYSSISGVVHNILPYVQELRQATQHAPSTSGARPPQKKLKAKALPSEKKYPPTPPEPPPPRAPPVSKSPPPPAPPTRPLGHTRNVVSHSQRRPLFRESSWEELLEAGFKEGRVLLLQYFKLGYTSDQIEEALRMAFPDTELNARLVPESQFPNYQRTGQAIVVVGSKTQFVQLLKSIEEGIFILTANGWPCLATVLKAPEKRYFPIKQYCLRIPEKFRDAVSTMHCSQSSTIEYEMALQWRVLDERHQMQWSELLKYQKEEARQHYTLNR